MSNPHRVDRLRVRALRNSARHVQRFANQGRCNTLLAIALAHIKARDTPYRQIVHALERESPIEPGQRIPRRQLAPPNQERDAQQSGNQGRKGKEKGNPAAKVVMT
jgi:hypothetical protein